MARQSRRACFVAGHQLGHGDTAASHAVPLLQSYIFERRASSAGSHGDNHKEDQCDEKDHTQQPFPNTKPPSQTLCRRARVEARTTQGARPIHALDPAAALLRARAYGARV